jgi:hypothetical protein
VLWNNNKIVLAVMLSTFFVSSQPTHHTKASDRCIDQTFSVVSISVTFAGTVPSACTRSHLPLVIHATETFCSLLQMQRARSRGSQRATRARPISRSSYRLFSFPCSNWVGNQEHIYVRTRVYRHSPQDS